MYWPWAQWSSLQTTLTRSSVSSSSEMTCSGRRHSPGTQHLLTLGPSWLRSSSSSAAAAVAALLCCGIATHTRTQPTGRKICISLGDRRGRRKLAGNWVFFSFKKFWFYFLVIGRGPRSWGCGHRPVRSVRACGGGCRVSTDGADGARRPRGVCVSMRLQHRPRCPRTAAPNPRPSSTRAATALCVHACTLSWCCGCSFAEAPIQRPRADNCALASTRSLFCRLPTSALSRSLHDRHADCSSFGFCTGSHQSVCGEKRQLESKTPDSNP